MGTHLAEVRGEEERLEQRVHVACRSLVLETDVAGELFRVVAVQAETGKIQSGPGALDDKQKSATHLTKLCQSTPVGSFSTRTKAVTSTSSPSIVGRA
jgi:hypothetical protein